ncbi:hypothetical protein ISF_07336 [Cordyceps fumosorosea ARSEF 2679]|uniref:Uncharacterized protein n=1 Tax=Cordyceps fumosorosea (strain ARSEF 2679) TaxID=1081104 RepID=A0A167PMI1_CORFA|nr:hypothetical protein ISF_07336 [Cordyceps fumosorosea ARSEF 2679]OAA56820.1 hypothetical protein ISF_07336 [Cordyceps fumosorosea ARSEF 2679]
MRAVAHEAGLPYAATPGALVGVVQVHHALRSERLLAPDEAVWDDLQTLWTLQGDASFFVGDLPTTKNGYFENHRASAQELDMALAERYTDSREHLQTEYKSVVEEAKVRHAALLPAGLVRAVAEAVEHERPGLCFDFFTIQNEAWLFLERLLTAILELPDGPSTLRDDGRMLPFVSGTVPASDALLHVATEVTRTFVSEGHGRRMRDRKRGTWPKVRAHRGGRFGGEEDADMNILQLLLQAAELKSSERGGDASLQALQNMLRMLGQN